MSNSQEISKDFEHKRRQERKSKMTNARTISQTASYFNGNKTKRSFPPSSRRGSASCCSSDGIVVVVVVSRSKNKVTIVFQETKKEKANGSFLFFI